MNDDSGSRTQPAVRRLDIRWRFDSILTCLMADRVQLSGNDSVKMGSATVSGRCVRVSVAVFGVSVAVFGDSRTLTSLHLARITNTAFNVTQFHMAPLPPPLHAARKRWLPTVVLIGAVCVAVGLLQFLAMRVFVKAGASGGREARFEPGLTYTNDRISRVPWSIHVLKIDRSRKDLTFFAAHARAKFWSKPHRGPGTDRSAGGGPSSGRG
jgi:hypothetical protein